MILYEYDDNGWYVGWIDTDNPPPFPSTRGKTSTSYCPIEPSYARFVNNYWIEDKSRAEAEGRRLLVSRAITSVQAILDAQAQAWGYDDIKSAATYIGDPDPKFNAEGLALRNWRSATWSTVRDNQDLISTIEQLLQVIPPPPSRPN
jgi:hypothetical protein